MLVDGRLLPTTTVKLSIIIAEVAEFYVLLVNYVTSSEKYLELSGYDQLGSG